MGLARWRFLAFPLVLWLVAVGFCVAVLSWYQHTARDAIVMRYHLRVGLMADFVTSYVADLIDRERVQAEALLTDRTVGPEDFARAVAGFGYSSGLLVDDRGRVLQAVGTSSELLGRDLGSRYTHLHTALSAGRLAVSTVVPSAVRGTPEVAFAVPFSTPYGRRVFSGAVEVGENPVSPYLSTALSLSGSQVQLIDPSGTIVAANRSPVADFATLDTQNPELAAAIARSDQGRYQQDDRWWQYSSLTVSDTPWRLTVTVREDVLFAANINNEIAGRAGVGSAAVVGLLVVGSSARARRNRRKLQVSEVFDNARIGMLLTNPAGQLTRVNPAFCQMLGRRAADLIGKYFTDYTHPDDADVGRAQMAECAVGRSEDFVLEKRYLHADGRIVETSVTCAVLRNQAGQARHFATQIIDVTERRTLERARERNEAELAQRAEQLADFIAMLTHDVRQPLANVVTGGEMLLEEWTDIDEETRCRYIRRMIAAGNRASNLVGEVLTLAQLDAGALVARPTKFDVGDLVRNAITAQGTGPEEPITAIAPDHAIGLADTTHLELILANPLGNATKYGAPPVTVTVTVDDNGEHIRIHVNDEGEGVPEAFVPRLFDRFARADTGVATTKAGTGLGLYLVRQLADASGIQIEYQPNKPRGSTFILTLDRA